MSKLKYFAYGSNMDMEQILERCPKAQLLGIAILKDHDIHFPRYSKNRDGGVISIRESGGMNVHGVVYSITEKDSENLDIAEGVKKNFYQRRAVSVLFDGKPLEVYTYVAVEQGNHFRPSDKYLAQIVGWAKVRGFPNSYIDHIIECSGIGDGGSNK